VSQWHVPVLLDRCLELLDIRAGGTYVDATLGGGGHSVAIAERLGAGGKLIGIDQDPDARSRAADVLAPFADRVRICAANFSELGACLDANGVGEIDGILFDLGVSSHQLDTPERGFALRFQGPLDMRMDPESGDPTAADLLNRESEAEIARWLFEWGEEPRSRRIAAEIVRSRPLATTEDLVDCVRRTMPFRTRPGQIHPATKVFQAVRIAVNREIEILEGALETAASRLAPSGRLVVISYHSLEDRIAKRLFHCLAGRREGSDFPDLQPDPVPTVSLVTRKPVVPTEDEIRANPRSRSAKLRCVEKLPAQESRT
jgi:16S rRNA (cytosine1402-N4)-methyltransferase